MQKKNSLDRSRTKLTTHGISGQEALSRLVALFDGINLRSVSGWMQLMGSEALDYKHDKEDKCWNNQQQRMIGAVEMLGTLGVIDETQIDTACGLILRIE